MTDSKAKYTAMLEAIAKLPQDKLKPVELFDKAVAEIGLDMLEEAKKTLTRIISMDASYPYSYFGLAEVYTKLKDFDRAAYFYKYAMKFRQTAQAAQEKLQGLNLVKEIDEESGRIMELKLFKSDITFKDVIGLDEVKKKLFAKVILPLRKPELYKKYGKDVNAGILLYGSAGGGKTWLARAIAGETGAYMITPKQHQIVNEFFGSSEKNLSAIFKQARANAPTIIFFDEFDAIAGKRSSYSGTGEEHGGGAGFKGIVNALLNELDGIEKNSKGLFIIAATNRPHDIDTAVRRPGRIGDSVYIPPPSFQERIGVFKYHLSKMKIAKNINYSRISRATELYSQADLKKICDDAADIPILREHHTGKEGEITTYNLLTAISKTKSSIDPWFMDARKEMVGSFSYEVVGNETRRKWQSAKLEPQEMNEYKQFIDDILRSTNNMAILSRKLKRATALYLG
jgi:SpoVK/Ycf46/Vps4 family AAA+-type ATPase